MLYEFGYGVFKNAGSCYLLATSTRNWESVEIHPTGLKMNRYLASLNLLIRE